MVAGVRVQLVYLLALLHELANRFKPRFLEPSQVRLNGFLLQTVLLNVDAIEVDASVVNAVLLRFLEGLE